MFAVVVSKRFMTAPNRARVVETVVSAASMRSMAARALVEAAPETTVVAAKSVVSVRPPKVTAIWSLVELLMPTWNVVARSSRLDQRVAVIGGRLLDAVDFTLKLPELGVEITTVSRALRAVGRLNRELAHAGEQAGDLTERSFSGLRHRDTVVRVALGY